MALSARAKPRPRLSKLAQAERRWGLLLASPWIIGLFLFSVFPMGFSLILAFTDYNLVSTEPVRFVGLKNWVNLFEDDRMRQSFLVTLRYLVLVVPFLILSPLVMAVILSSRHLRWRSFWVTLFFLPNLIPAVVTGLIWNNVLNTRGPINEFTQRWFGWEGPAWLLDAAWVMPAIAVIGLWSIGYTMLNMMAALQSVPKELYEAATIDGATPVQSFFRISLPLMSNVIFYNVVTGIIGGFQYFTIAYLLYRGQGGPNDAALFFMLKLYKEAFNYYNMGFASTMAWAMFLVCLVITQLLFATSRRWVYYAAEVRE